MNPADDLRDLVVLDPDHPGFRDPVYRTRRNAIARAALTYRSGRPVPDAPYTEEEHAVWRTVWEALEPLHEAHAASRIRQVQRTVALDRRRIPQLREVNAVLRASTGFRMEPVAGLVSARAFLRRLGQGVFPSTQYIRHHSRPLYTPEPDVVHELVGHAATLADPGIAEVNRVIGAAAEVADAEEILRLERVYWYTLEFGAVEEQGTVRAFGAGLLSSAGEIAQMGSGPALLDWDLDRIASTPYDPTAMQPALFVAPSVDRLLDDVRDWALAGRRRRRRAG